MLTSIKTERGFIVCIISRVIKMGVRSPVMSTAPQPVFRRLRGSASANGTMTRSPLPNSNRPTQPLCRPSRSIWRKGIQISPDMKAESVMASVGQSCRFEDFTGRGLDRQHDLAHALATFERAMRLGRVGQGEDAVDHDAQPLLGQPTDRLARKLGLAA